MTIFAMLKSLFSIGISFHSFSLCLNAVLPPYIGKVWTNIQPLGKGFLVSSQILMNSVKSHLMERFRKSLKHGHVSVLIQKTF